MGMMSIVANFRHRCCNMPSTGSVQLQGLTSVICVMRPRRLGQGVSVDGQWMGQRNSNPQTSDARTSGATLSMSDLS